MVLASLWCAFLRSHNHIIINLLASSKETTLTPNVVWYQHVAPMHLEVGIMCTWFILLTSVVLVLLTKQCFYISNYSSLAENCKGVIMWHLVLHKGITKRIPHVNFLACLVHITPVVIRGVATISFQIFKEVESTIIFGLMKRHVDEFPFFHPKSNNYIKIQWLFEWFCQLQP